VNCSICRRESQHLEKHHLVPRAKHGKETIEVCHDCGDQLHLLFDNRQLKYELNTLEKILANEKVQIWIKWIRKKKEFGICMKRKK